jgi:hypothetical protein
MHPRNEERETHDRFEKIAYLTEKEKEGGRAQVRLGLLEGVHAPSAMRDQLAKSTALARGISFAVIREKR